VVVRSIISLPAQGAFVLSLKYTLQITLKPDLFALLILLANMARPLKDSEANQKTPYE